ncbi:hypothetical protein [Pelistega sp. MC2]|uniref:hypothetical protein n=1 Tax=Pelistega sp. MC2 TaxID=1720297 RepID=UPI0008DA2790|nr:hypothetical protein [Pelistega sp. MC2]
MYKNITIALMSLSTTLAWAEESYQVGYSKKEDLVIIADNANESNWCKTDLQLRFQAGSNASEESVKALFPKLGNLFNKLCPKAETLTWSYVDVQHNVVLKGNTNKSQEWAFVLENNVASKQKVTAEKEEESSKSDVVTQTTITDKRTEESTKEVPQTTAVVENAPVQSSTEISSEQTVVTDTVEKIESVDKMQSFPVSGWRPLLEEERQKLIANFQTMKNQDGCKVLSFFDFKGQENYVQIITKGVGCDQNGFLDGEGTVRVERSDGEVLLREREFVFKHGLPFTGYTKISGPQELEIFYTPEGSIFNQHKLFFGIGSSQELNAHYFLVAYKKDYAGFGAFEEGSDGLILTNRAEDFRQASTIKKQLETAFQYFNHRTHNQSFHLRLTFVEGLQKGLDEYSMEQKLYRTEFSRNRAYGKNWQAYAKGEWKQEKGFGTTNYLFEREQRLAHEKALEAKRLRREKAYEAEKQLNKYRELQALDWSTSDKVQQNIYQNIQAGTRNYVDMLEGKQKTLSSLVRVDSIQNGKAQVVWPYSMVLSLPLEKGWYWIRGQQSFSTTQLDKVGLPLTEVTIDDTAVFKCQQEMCADLQNPQTIARIQFGIPDWSPEKAQQLIIDARK